MRVAIAALAIASGLAIQALSPAYASYDSWGRWHPNYYRPHYYYNRYGYNHPYGYYHPNHHRYAYGYYWHYYHPHYYYR